MRILDKAITIDDKNPIALTLSGIGHQQKGIRLAQYHNGTRL